MKRSLSRLRKSDMARGVPVKPIVLLSGPEYAKRKRELIARLRAKAEK